MIRTFPWKIMKEGEFIMKELSPQRRRTRYSKYTEKGISDDFVQNLVYDPIENALMSAGCFEEHT